MRQGVSEVGVTELLGVVEHYFSMSRVMLGARVQHDGTVPQYMRGSVPGLVDVSDAPTRTVELLKRIESTEAASTGIPSMSSYWLIVGNNYKYLEASWNKHQVVMRPGELTTTYKLVIAYAIAYLEQNEHLLIRLATTLQNHAFEEPQLLEIVGVIDHYCSFNMITDFMQVESDIRVE